MNFINKNVLKKELFYDNTLILKYHIEYPSIYSNTPEYSIMKFNMYNRNLAFQLKSKSEIDLYKEAIETYKYNKENGYPTMVYEIYRTFEITYNSLNIISLYADEYIFTWKYH